MIDAKQAKTSSALLQGFAEPNRLRIIDALRTGPKNVTEIATALRIEIVNASHHLGVLRQAGLVCDEKKGRFVIYTLNPDLFKSRNGETTADLGWCVVHIPVA